MTGREKATYSGNTVPKLTKAIYPWSGIFRDACYALVGTFLLQYAMTAGVLSSDFNEYTAQMHVITIFMMIALVWDGINDPIMGFLVEKFHFRSGKYKPWILIGSIGNAVAVTLMFIVGPLGVTGWGYVACMLVFYFLWDTFFTMNDIGYWSMLPSLTNDPTERAKLTTNVTVATTIGAFVMNMMMFLLPNMLGAQTAYAGVSVIISILFLVSQAAIYFFCQEKERDAKQEEISEESHFLDLFKIVIQNKQLLVIVIVMFLYYIGSGLLTGIGLNYYYLLYSYGVGGYMATGMSLVYVAGTLLAQVFYPMLVKVFKKKQIIFISSIVILAAYLLFFFFGFPVFGNNPIAYSDPSVVDPDNLLTALGFVFGGTHFLIFIACFFFFAATGIFYLALLVMFQDAIDYQEWKFGERKEAVCFAWRPLDVKLGSALQTGIRNLTFVLTGTQVILNRISNAESHNIFSGFTPYSEEINGATVTYSTMDEAIQGAYTWSDKSRQLTLFGIIIIGIILVVFAGCLLLLHFGYKIDEDMEKQIVADLEKRHAEDALLANKEKEATPVREDTNHSPQA